MQIALEYLNNTLYKINMDSILKSSKYMKLRLSMNLIIVLTKCLRDYLVQTKHYMHEEIKSNEIKPLSGGQQL